MERLRTLVVDDEPGMRSGIERALARWEFRIADIDETFGFDVRSAEDGARAREAIREWNPDLLLLDHKLPDTTGLDLLRECRAESGDRVTVMITAYASLETAVSAIKGGAFDFLAKPFTPDELRKTVSKAAQHLILARQVRKLAQEKQQVRFQFISVLGHELKSPLNAVEGYLSMVRDRTLGGALEDYDESVGRSLLRLAGMRKIINDLLDLTRIESGTKRRDLGDHDISGVARTALETAVPEAARRGISLSLEETAPLVMTCDPGEIEMVLNNLVSNAVKYNRDGGRVSVRLSRDGDAVTVSVSDTGIGLSESDIAGLFREFSRVKNEKTRHILGSGLGLTIVKKIAALYGGEVSVASVPDRGTTFTVTLRASGA